MKATWISFAIVIGAGLLCQPWLRAGDGKDLNTKDLEGTYRLVWGEKDGKKLPEDEVKGAKVRFTADTIIATDQDRTETYSATYKLDGNKIFMTSVKPAKGMKTHGLVKKEDGKLHLIYALPDEETKRIGKAPTEFRTQKGQLMVVLEKLEE